MFEKMDETAFAECLGNKWEALKGSIFLEMSCYQKRNSKLIKKVTRPWQFVLHFLQGESREEK